MDRPSWAPVILSGVLPRELSDLLAIAILELVTVQVAFSGTPPFSGLSVSWILLLFVPLTSGLAALSNSPSREREELALVAYGGSVVQIELRYVLRGAIISVLGLLPLILKVLTVGLSSAFDLALFVILVFVGGIAFATPASKRTRSLSFVEQYKG